jgi:hypothetical protein
MGQRQVRGRSVRCERASRNVDDRGAVVSCWWTPSSDEHSPCGMGSTGFLEMLCCRKASRVPGRGKRLYPGGDGTGARLNGGEDDADGGENVGLARKLLPVMWNPV